METNVAETNEVKEVKDEGRRDGALRRRARKNSGARFSVLVHLVAYVSINLILFFINLLTFGGFWWVLLPVFFWGVGLFFHAVAALLVPSIGSVRRRMYDEELDRLHGKA